MKNTFKSFAFVALALVALLFSACTTTSTTPQDRSAAITSAMLELAGTSFAPILANNPDYVPVAQAVADGLGVVELGEINADTIRAFVAQIAQHHQFSPAQRAYAELIVTSAWTIYTAQTGTTSAQLSDPNIKAWVASFRRGLASAIAISGDLKTK